MARRSLCDTELVWREKDALRYTPERLSEELSKTTACLTASGLPTSRILVGTQLIEAWVLHVSHQEYYLIRETGKLAKSAPYPILGWALKVEVDLVCMPLATRRGLSAHLNRITAGASRH